MLTERQIKILKTIIDEFIETAEPVGSKLLMDKYELPYSSATIRNDMQVLEEQGYLEKTHTSSGRVPSVDGYKYYCEHLLDNKLDKRMEVALNNIFESNMNVEEAIQKSCDIISQMTNLASGVLGPDSSLQKLEHIKIFPIDNRNVVCVFITNTGHTENKNFQFDEDISLDDIQNCCDILNKRLEGTPIDELADKMETIKPLLKDHVERYDMLFKAFMGAFIKFSSDNVYFSGKTNMLYQPEFEDIEKLRRLMNMLQDATIWRQIDADLVSNKNENAIKMTNKSELVWMNDVAVVRSKFKMNDADEAQLMVVGPQRMNYDRIVPLLEYVSAMLEKMYGGNNQK